jgi:thiosulfate reductase cytochrome b subunit
VFALALRGLTWWQAALCAIAALLFNAFVLPGAGGKTIVRPTDAMRGYPLGILLYPLAVLLLIVAFPTRLDIAGSAWGIMAFGDGTATLVGRRWGRHPLAWNPAKTVEGLAAFVVAGAAAGIGLIATGLEIHGTRGPVLLSLPVAVAVHNTFAVILIVNGFLALFYHLTTAAIRNFIPQPRGFLASALEHMTYQARGIFYGESHPRNAAGQKLNPLQQVTYLALLNVLFPLQIVTGALIWAVGRWPEVATAVGGLRYVAPLHNLGSWFFLTFFVLHVYLVSTGRTPTDHLKSMITGYQHVDVDAPAPEGAER